MLALRHEIQALITKAISHWIPSSDVYITMSLKLYLRQGIYFRFFPHWFYYFNSPAPFIVIPIFLLCQASALCTVYLLRETKSIFIHKKYTGEISLFGNQMFFNDFSMLPLCSICSSEVKYNISELTKNLRIHLTMLIVLGYP